MLSHRLILSLSAIATLSASTSAFALQSSSSSHASKTAQNTIYIANDPIEVGAKEFISGLAEKGIGVIENTDIPADIRQKKFRDLLHSNFDMKTIARFALGRYWKTSSASEKKEYLRLFEDMIVKVYSRRFSEYNGQVLDITSARPDGRSDAIVYSIIVPNSGPKIHVDWRVRKKKSGTLKVIDIMVEGVSMSLTQRSDFASVIQRGGGKIEVLLAHLRPEDKTALK